MKALSRLAAPLGETSVARPFSSLTTRNGARRALPRVPSTSNHQRSSSPTYADETSNEEGDPGGALELREERVFHGARAAPPLHVRGDSNGIGILGQPEREVEQRNAVLEKGAAAGLGAAKTPAVGRTLPAKRAGAYADDAPQLAAVDETRQRLDVGAIPVIVRHSHDAIRARGGGENSFDSPRVQRQRALAQHVLARGQRAQRVRLVEMVRRGDDDRVERVLLEQILDVGVDVGDAETVGERARFRPVVVAERDELRAAHLRQDRQMRDLRDGSRADDADSNGLLHGFALRALTCRGCDQSNTWRRREPEPSGGRPRDRRARGPPRRSTGRYGRRAP